MLSAVIIILREVLEAALIVSILLAVSYRLGLSRRWSIPGIGFGVLLAAVLAWFTGDISEAAEGAGQELMNGLLLTLMVILTAMVCRLIARINGKELDSDVNRQAKNLFVLIVLIAVCREGSEVLIFAYGLSFSPDGFLPLLIGCSLGAGIGASVGAIFYYLLVHLSRPVMLKLSIALFVLIAAGLSSQIALNLIQAGWLPSQMPLWDSSALLPEDAVIGQMLYALVGYEATPTMIQVGFYIITAALLCLIVGWSHAAVLRKQQESGNANEI
jgi:high-affinity iron transporter